MDAADKAGGKTDPNGNAAGSGNASEQSARYIITRPCLAEGSLRLLKYLQPMFPADGQLTLQDERGQRFELSVDALRGRLTGVGELYRAHNMGVNDVLMLSRESERQYGVTCVVKPHARVSSATQIGSQAGSERTSAAGSTAGFSDPGYAGSGYSSSEYSSSEGSAAQARYSSTLVTEKRVVIHATPHVREVRLERVAQEPTQGQQFRNRYPRSQDSQPPKPSQRAELSPQITALSPQITVQPAPDQPAALEKAALKKAVPKVAATPTPLTVQMNQSAISAAALNTAAALKPKVESSVVNDAQAAAPMIQEAQVVETQAPLISKPVPATSETAQQAPMPSGAAELRIDQPSAALSSPVQLSPVQLNPVPLSKAPAATTALAARPVSDSPNGPQAPEDQLAALARLTGYACEHLGSGVVRLRAELGHHGYSVLIATTPEGLNTPAWNESCDYMALLTPEDQRPQGIPRFTHAALEALLEHAQLAPLTPIDLRGYWNTGSFDQESVESVAELVSAHLALRGSFSHVLVTLAQQPAHSLVQVPRLAERLGSGVNNAELHSILETLTRPPFLALTPLPGGQYYLRSDVRELLQEFGEYAEGMRRRLKPAPLAPTGL
jgi:hypothetical protein